VALRGLLVTDAIQPPIDGVLKMAKEPKKKFKTPASGYGNVTVLGDGILCSSNVYVAMTNLASVTVFYG